LGGGGRDVEVEVGIEVGVGIEGEVGIGKWK